MSTKHTYRLPDFIEASGLVPLRLLMLQTNLKYNQMFEYYDIQSYVDKKGKTKWVAWFTRNLTDKEINEGIN